MKEQAKFTAAMMQIEPELTEVQQEYLKRWLAANRFDLTPGEVKRALQLETPEEWEVRSRMGLPPGPKGAFLLGRGRAPARHDAFRPNAPFVLNSQGKLYFETSCLRSPKEFVESLEPILAMLEVWGCGIVSNWAHWRGVKTGNQGKVFIEGAKVEAVPAQVLYPPPSWWDRDKGASGEIPPDFQRFLDEM